MNLHKCQKSVINTNIVDNKNLPSLVGHQFHLFNQDMCGSNHLLFMLKNMELLKLFHTTSIQALDIAEIITKIIVIIIFQYF